MANRRTKVDAVIPSPALVASAVRYSGKAGRIYQQGKEWQKEAYRHYGICGEARFAATYYGNALSRCTLDIVETTTGGAQKPVTSGAGYNAMTDLFGGSQAAIMKSLGIHLTVAGECYLVGRDIQPEDVEDGEQPLEAFQLWEIISVLEMKVTGEKWSIRRGGNARDIDLTDEDVVIRIWISDPADQMQADSPFKSLLPILSEIEWLTRHVFAQVQSRLAGAGILFLPQNMSFPPPPEQDGDMAPLNEAEQFMLSLADGLVTPITDPSSPSAIVPYIVTAPADAIDKAKLMTFWSELDAESKALRQEGIHRFALGMDLPPEQILGMSSNKGTGGGTSTGVSHWGAWQIEESTIKLFIEPMVEVVCNALTIKYLRPASGGDEFLIPNTKALRLRPDRSQEAILLYNLGVLSAERLLVENGFAKEDLPNDADRRQWLLMKVATGSATPDMVAAALRELGLDLGDGFGGQLNEARPDPSMEPLPLPKGPPEAALLAASEGLVFRALERAGNRLRNEGNKPPVPSYETHTLVSVNGQSDFLLTDAWSCAPQVLSGIADSDVVVPLLTEYCKTLFASQAPHTRERLAAWLERGIA